MVYASPENPPQYFCISISGILVLGHNEQQLRMPPHQEIFNYIMG